jgi:hypothetical protein
MKLWIKAKQCNKRITESLKIDEIIEDDEGWCSLQFIF